jgi:GTPase
VSVDLESAPVITRHWWVAGHVVLVPPIRWLLRLRVDGAHNIPPEGPVLIVSNHISQIDPPVLGVAALPRRSHYMAKAELFRIPLLRRIIHRMGAFPVERGGADRRALRVAREVLRRGDVLLMFPEGTRYLDGRLRPGLPGAGSLGLEPGVTVVPAAIWGSHRLLRRVRVVFGPPVDLSDIPPGPRSVRSRGAADRMMAAIPRPAGRPPTPRGTSMADASERARWRPRRVHAGETLASDQPVVAIVGYPNVGKSTLFNRLAGRRDAVVDAVPGVTRDRRQAGAEWNGRAFQLVDTGGIDDADPSDVGRQTAAQALRGVDEADLVLFVVDVQTAPTSGDLEVLDRLRRSGRPLMLIVNKVDDAAREAAAQNLRSLGIEAVHPVSAQHGRGIGDLLDALVEALPGAPAADAEHERVPALCIIGRPNVGKSSILNALLGEDRVVVHDRPGTTRDPIDTLIEVDGRRVVLIDTAGLRRRGQMSEDVEHYSQIRALQSAERSDVALVVADATEGLTEADLGAVDRAARAHCATLLVINKWDLAQPDLEHIRGRLRSKSRQRPPIEVCSAATGEGLHRLLPAALRLEERSRSRLSTRQLNQALRELAAERPGPRKGQRRLSLRYLVQTGEAPPTFRLDVNDRALMTRDYGFWLENRLRQRFDLDGVPLDIEVRSRA